MTVKRHSVDELRKMAEEADGEYWSWEPAQSPKGTRYQHVLVVGAGADHPDLGKGVFDTYHAEALDVVPPAVIRGYCPPRDGNPKNATHAVAWAPRRALDFLDDLENTSRARERLEAFVKSVAELPCRYEAWGESNCIHCGARKALREQHGEG